MLWHALNAGYLYGLGSMSIIAPTFVVAIERSNATDNDDVSPITITFVRMYGMALISFATLLRGVLQSRKGDGARTEMSSILFACALLFALQLMITIAPSLIAVRLIGVIGNLVYESIDGGGVLRRTIGRWLRGTCGCCGGDDS